MREIENVPSPCYVLELEAFRRNLEVVRGVAEAAGVTIILAFKAFAFHPVFPWLRSLGLGATASSLNEARLAVDKLGARPHTYAPVYLPDEADELARLSQCLSFNSLDQHARLHGRMRQVNPRLSFGLRVNPGSSPVGTDKYNPCVAGSRLGIPLEQLPDALPDDIEGLHVHALCESSASDSIDLLARVEEGVGAHLPRLRWLNLGGGHLMTRQGYDRAALTAALRAFRERHPKLRVILEPGSAFAWRAGYLRATVLDIVRNGGIATAILDVSFACHMPDCLEMPYQPEVRGAEQLAPGEPADDPNVYRLGGCSCLAGDYVGLWRFPSPLQVGDPIVLEDMMHYTTVKTTMFNGVRHPSLAIDDGSELRVVRRFGYNDYLSRMG